MWIFLDELDIIFFLLEEAMRDDPYSKLLIDVFRYFRTVDAFEFTQDPNGFLHLALTDKPPRALRYQPGCRYC